MSEDQRELVDRLLDAARRDVAPDEAERQSKIFDRVAGAGGGGNGPLSGARSGRSWLGVGAAGLGAIALVGAGVFMIGRSSSREEQRSGGGGSPTPAQIESAAPIDNPSVVARSGTGTASVGTSVWELPSVATAQKVSAPSAPSVTSRHDVVDELALELAALESARRRLRDRDPGGAMKLLDDFDRRFPRPRAGEEAAVLRIEVLLGLGRADDARRIGRDFIARRPDSIYRARVAQLLGDASP